MISRFLFVLLVFPLLLSGASCISEKRLFLKNDIVYQENGTTTYSGCITQKYPNGQKKSERFFLQGRLTGDEKHWFENGQMESEVIYKSGKLHSKKQWNMQGYLYTFEKYKNGKLLQSIKMTYKQAIAACKKASFDNHPDWILPNVKELHKVPFSESTREMSFIASNPPKKGQSGEEIAYVHFGSDPESSRWDNNDMHIDTLLDVICIRKNKPQTFRQVLGVGGIADLQSGSFTKKQQGSRLNKKPSTPKKKVAPAAKKVDNKLKSSVLSQTPEPTKNYVLEKVLKPGYYISIYTFVKLPPEKTKLDNIMLSGYRYKYSAFTNKGVEMTRVLIGPFSSEDKARKELKRVHELIEPGAFIIDKTH